MQLPLFKEESRVILCSKTYYSSFESAVEKKNTCFQNNWEKQDVGKCILKYENTIGKKSQH